MDAAKTGKKGIQRLLNLGMNKDDIGELVGYLEAQVGQVLMFEMMTDFSEEELLKIEQELKKEGLDKVDQFAHVTQAYIDKNGKNPTERAQEILETYLQTMAGILQGLKGLNEKVSSAEESVLRDFDDALQSKDWGKMKEILDKMGIVEKDLEIKSCS